jgi:uncharacterized integral membrane protein
MDGAEGHGPGKIDLMPRERVIIPYRGGSTMILLILIILIVAVVTVFSVQNAVPVTLSFLVWRFSASLAVLIFLAILTGMLIASLFSLSARVKKSLPGKGRRSKGAGVQDKPAQDRSSSGWSGPPNS